MRWHPSGNMTGRDEYSNYSNWGGDTTQVENAFAEFRNLNIGDCELVEEFVRQVIPKLAVRNLQRDITCVPYQQSSGSYRVSGEVLKPLTAQAPASATHR